MKSLAVSDDPVALEAAEDVLLGGGSALGAVVAGFFAAAGAHSGVILSPATLLAAGPGLGARAFDGRARQPGLGTRRPRGFKEGEEIPLAARMAVPAAVTAILVAMAYDEQAKLGRVLKSGVRRARDSGAESRAALLERIRAVGGAAMSESTFVRPLLFAGGEASGGVLTSTDLGSVRDVDVAAVTREIGGVRCQEPPWAADEVTITEELGRGHAVCAVDVRGLFAALCYRRVPSGISVDELELEAPAIAEPVRRGVTRVAPGGPLPSPSPAAIVVDDTGKPVEVIAAPSAARLDARTMAEARLRIRWDPTVNRPARPKS